MRIENYHEFSKQQEQQDEEEFLVLFGVLLNRLANILTLTKPSIIQTIKIWEKENASQLLLLNKNGINKVNKYVDKLIPHNLAKKNSEFVTEAALKKKLFTGNEILLDVLIDYIQNEFIQISVLQNSYGYNDEQIKESLEHLVDTIQSKVADYVAFTIKSNIRTNLFNNALSNGFTEYKWQTQKDSKVRPTHARMQEEWVAIDSPPAITNHMHVGEDYGCRCFANEFR